ncbi:MAG: DUF721 domain-containing protein [bacterium]
MQFKEALKRYLKGSGLGERLRHGDVHQAWSQALGVKNASRARSVAYRGGELIVEVESAAHKQELETFTADRYRRKANQFLGTDRIHRVTIKMKK